METKTAGEQRSVEADVSPGRFRDAMARVGAAVNIVTTDGRFGRAGFTASAVCSVTDTPPTLLVCLNRAASVYDTFKRNGVLCINTLARGHEDLSRRFGGSTPMPERFADAGWTILKTGSPVLIGAIASFDCRVNAMRGSGTHDVLFCKAVAVSINPSAEGLVYFNRRYHGLSIA